MERGNGELERQIKTNIPIGKIKRKKRMRKRRERTERESKH